GGGGEEGGVGQQPVEDLLGGELGPYLVDELPDRPRAGHRVLHPVVGGLTALLHADEHGVGEALGESRTAGAVAGGAAQRGDDLPYLVIGDAVAGAARGVDEAFRGFGDVQPQRPLEDRRHPGVPFERRYLRRLGRVVVAEEPGDGRLVDLDLAEGGQHRRDVGQEGAVRADDHDAGAGQPLAVGEQQVGGAVQADRGLTGAGRALHAHGPVEVGADDVVLVGLDGRDDVAHGAGAGPLDLLGEDLRGVRALAVRPVERFVLVGGQLAALVAEAAAQPYAHRVGGARLVERAGDGRAPVDDEGTAVLVMHVASADVQAWRQVIVVGPFAVSVAVETAEEQRGVGVVGERGDPFVEEAPQDLLGYPVAGGVGGQGAG